MSFLGLVRRGEGFETRDGIRSLDDNECPRSRSRSRSRARSGGRQSGFGFGVFSEWRGDRTLDSGALGASSVCYFRATARRDAARCISPLSTVRPPCPPWTGLSDQEQPPNPGRFDSAPSAPATPGCLLLAAGTLYWKRREKEKAWPPRCNLLPLPPPKEPMVAHSRPHRHK